MITVEIQGPTFDTCASCSAYVAVDVIIAGSVQMPLCASCLGALKSKLCVGMVLPAARARCTDPDTSRLAARSVNITKGQKRVRDLITREFGTTTDFTLDDLVAAAARRWTQMFPGNYSPSGVRSRCRELVDHGIVVRLGEVKLKSGRSGHVHRLVRT